MKFDYGDRVEVIIGFYKGLKGFVTRIEETDNEEKYNHYYVEMEGLIGNVIDTVSDWLSEHTLRKINE